MDRRLVWMLAGGLLSIVARRVLSTHASEQEEDGESGGDFDPNDPDNWIGLDYVHDHVLTQLDRQEERWKEVDGRLRLVLGVIGIVFAAASGFVRSSQPLGNDPLTGLLPFMTGAAVTLSLGLYLVTGAMVAWAYRPQNFDRPPKPAEMRETYVTTDPREAKLELLDFVLLAYHRNEMIIETKLRWFTAAYSVAVVATAAMGVALITQIIVQTRAWGL